MVPLQIAVGVNVLDNTGVELTVTEAVIAEPSHPLAEGVIVKVSFCVVTPELFNVPLIGPATPEASAIPVTLFELLVQL